MGREDVVIQAPGGSCRASLFRPAAGGRLPAVLMYMDGIGYRPALFAIGQRLADAGYVVLLPDFFYRGGIYDPQDAKALFSDPAARDAFRKFAAGATMDNVIADTGVLLDWLAARGDVRPGKVGLTGYCMGGRWALAAAGYHAGRVAAIASFHGGNLANDAPDSPHLLAPRMTGTKVYIAGAVQDPSFPDEMKQRLADALAAAGVDHRIETYEGMRHGWVPPDTPVHSAEGSERHFRAMFDLFESALARQPATS